MSKNFKIALFLLVLFVVAVFTSLYFSGYLLLRSLGQPITWDALHWNTFIETFKVYGNKKEYLDYMLWGVGGFVAPLFFYLFLAVITVIAFSEKKNLHGNARLASDKDLSNSTFLPKKDDPKKSTAILIGKIAKGKHKGEFLQYMGQQFLMLYAPTRSGKGVSIVVVNCLYYQESLVVLDIKLENFMFTAGHREKNLEQEVFLFCPDGYANEKDKSLRTHRYNPLSYIRRDPVNLFGDLTKISTILFPLSGKGDSDMWVGLSANVFNALVLFLLDCEDETKTVRVAKEIDDKIIEDDQVVARYKVTMSQVYKLSTPSDGSSLGVWFENQIKIRNSDSNVRAWKKHLSDPQNTPKPDKNILSENTVLLMRQFSQQKDTQQKSIMLTFNDNMKMFANPITAAATDGNDFDFREIRRKKMTVYYGLAPSAISTYERLTNLFFSQLLNENVRTLPEHDPSLKYQCLLMLDEFTSMGKLDIIQVSLAFTAGYNLRFVFILQNREQLFDDKKGYGKNGGQTILKNCAVEIVFPPRDVDETIKELSETIGYYDLNLKNKSRSSGKQSSRSVSDNVQKRALLLPQEIIELRDKKHKSGISLNQLVISEFCRPLICDKIIYFDEPFFLERKVYSENNVPKIPKINISQVEIEKQLFELRNRDKEIS